MIVGRRNRVDCVLEVDYFRFKKVNSFKYLGLIVSETNNITKEVVARIQAGNRTCETLMVNELNVQSHY